jgi:hypothetical protein
MRGETFTTLPLALRERGVSRFGLGGPSGGSRLLRSVLAQAEQKKGVAIFCRDLAVCRAEASRTDGTTESPQKTSSGGVDGRVVMS